MRKGLCFFIFLFEVTLANNNYWQKLAESFSFQHYYHNPAVQFYIHDYAKRVNILNIELTRAQHILPYVVRQLNTLKMPTDFALLPIIESGYSPMADSTAGAEGLWQLMQSTVMDAGFDPNHGWPDPRRDIILSTQVALKDLENLYLQFNRDWFLALSAYNAGPSVVQNALDEAKQKGHSTAFWQLQLPAQTEHYVPRLIALCYMVTHAKTFHIQLPTITQSETAVPILLPKPMALEQLPGLLHLNKADFQMLNPGFQQSDKMVAKMTPILILSKDIPYFIQHLKLPEPNRSPQRYVVKPGDNLAAIAQHFHTTVSAITHWNRLDPHAMLPVDKTLLIPTKNA